VAPVQGDCQVQEADIPEFESLLDSSDFDIFFCIEGLEADMDQA
jgi:hypothetical protein